MLFPAQRAHGSNPPNPLGLAERVPRIVRRLCNRSPVLPPQRPPSPREGDRPQAVEGVSLPHSVEKVSSLHLTGFTRRSKPPVLPPIEYRGFAIAPITLRPPSQRYLLIPPAPRPPSPKTSLFEGGGPPAGGGRSSRPSPVEGVPAHRAPISLRMPSRSPLYNPGCRVATLLVSMGVMGFLGDSREDRN